MSERVRGRWRFDSESGELAEAASAAELEAERAAREAADQRRLRDARESYLRDRDDARR